MSTIYLYIKQCNHCDLKYFGFTTYSDPFSYGGSGSYWKNHLKKHKTSYKTIEIWGFDDQELATNFALNFSEKHNIVYAQNNNKKIWANLMPENAKHGSSKGRVVSEETRRKQSIAFTGRKESDETKAKKSINSKRITKDYWDNNENAELRKLKMSLQHTGKEVKESTRQKLRDFNLGKKIPKEITENWGEERKARRWFTDEIKNYHLSPDRLYLVEELNLRPGRIFPNGIKRNINQKTTKGTIRITDGISNRNIPKTDIIPTGWYKGITKKN